ncbi:MAG: MBL fold metallo-hydrolase [Chloroflexi bacterium]|nr:MBL fold metallo-hydrolase [Chloroflexota bacterium]
MPDFHLTVLGSGPSWPNPGGACSGYLASANGTRILLDCGPGVAGRLLANVSLRDLSAIVISHMHPDHFLDLVAVRNAVTYGGQSDRPPRLLLPPGGADVLAALGRVLDGDEHAFARAFDVGEYDPSATVEIGPCSLSFRRMRHPVPAFATRVEAGRALVFSGDTGPCEALVALARGADMLLCESTLVSAEGESAKGERMHLSGAEAGQIAREAGVSRLLLTHMPIDPDDPERQLRDARAVFSGAVEHAAEGRRYAI